MNILKDQFGSIRKKAAEDFSLFGLKATIILWCLVIIFMVLSIDNKWILAGILAYEILP